MAVGKSVAVAKAILAVVGKDLTIPAPQPMAGSPKGPARKRTAKRKRAKNA